MSLFHLSALTPAPLLSVLCQRPGAADLLWAWPVVERLQQESLNPKLMDTQLAASASLLAPPSAFQNNSSSSNNNKKMLRGEAEKELVGFYINFIHMLCSVLRGLDPSWERFQIGRAHV